MGCSKAQEVSHVRRGLSRHLASAVWRECDIAENSNGDFAGRSESGSGLLKITGKHGTIQIYSGRIWKLANADTKKIVDKAWNFAHVLRDDGLSYMAYTEQIAFLLFLKMDDEQSKPPYNKKIGVPKEFNWASLLERDGEELEPVSYTHLTLPTIYSV